jgi:peptide chain release factor subunit 1
MQTSELTPERLRALAETKPERGLVVSLYLDLDPSRFATPQARLTEINSLLDEVAGQVDPHALEHGEEVALREDLERVRRFLRGSLPADGAHGLALFSSSAAGLFEAMRLPRPVPSAATIDTRPYIEPLAELVDPTRWAVLLVNRRYARILRGRRNTLAEVAAFEDAVHGQHDQGGWSQPNYERSIERDVDEHLKRAAEELFRHYKRAAFDALLLGAPEELAPAAEERLHPYLRGRLAGRLTVDVERASPDDVLAAAESAFTARERERERAALERLREGIGAAGRAAAGWDQVLAALNERRVEALLLDDRGHGPGAVCPQCGWLGVGRETCPVDGTALGRRPDIAGAAVEAAVRQSADVIRVRHHDDLGPLGGVGVLLRF